MRLVVASAPDAPELSLLAQLPPASRPLAVGRTLAALRAFPGVTDASLATADTLLCAGWGAESPAALSEILAALPSLRWLHTATAGVGHLLVPELGSAVVLTNARGVFSASLAEWALAACLWFAKDFPRLARQQAERKWEAYDVEELRGRTLAVVGLGDIGAATARLARAFGMRVVALRRTPCEPDGLVAAYFTPGPGLCAMLSEADYVVLATPLTAETARLMGEHEFAAMKTTAVFVNVGRGACVDEAALVAALQAGRLRGAALDVFEVEPLPSASPLWGMANVMVSPHGADRTAHSQHDSLRVFLDNVGRRGDGRPLVNVVDRERGY